VWPTVELHVALAEEVAHTVTTSLGSGFGFVQRLRIPVHSSVRIFRGWKRVGVMKTSWMNTQGPQLLETFRAACSGQMEAGIGGRDVDGKLWDGIKKVKRTTDWESLSDFAACSPSKGNIIRP